MPNGDHRDYPPESDADVIARVLRERKTCKEELRKQQEENGRLREENATLKKAFSIVRPSD